MDYVKHSNFLGVETKDIPCIVGNGEPDSTINATGLLYMDEDTGEVYKRTKNGWVLLVPEVEIPEIPEIPNTPNIYVADGEPTDLTSYEIGDIIMIKETE